MHQLKSLPLIKHSLNSSQTRLLKTLPPKTQKPAASNEATGDVVFSVPIKEFEFEKSLMKEHFNEKYMESEQYPKATFQGKIAGYQGSVSGEQKATATG